WLMMSLWDALRMNMMISYQELVRTFPSKNETFYRRLNNRLEKVLWSNLNGHFDRVFSPRQGT
ncbi:hypothetical protein ACOWZ0_29255, partial [Klebsiella pneumoniae]|uniref:hypothetical protein n=1 Tax=Klebsiella pneumoniae TaxID=573 RepID=UPI0026DF9EBC